MQLVMGAVKTFYLKQKYFSPNSYDTFFRKMDASIFENKMVWYDTGHFYRKMLQKIIFEKVNFMSRMLQCNRWRWYRIFFANRTWNKMLFIKFFNAERFSLPSHLWKWLSPAFKARYVFYNAVRHRCRKQSLTYNNK